MISHEWHRWPRFAINAEGTIGAPTCLHYTVWKGKPVESEDLNAYFTRTKLKGQSSLLHAIAAVADGIVVTLKKGFPKSWKHFNEHVASLKSSSIIWAAHYWTVDISRILLVWPDAAAVLTYPPPLSLFLSLVPTPSLSLSLSLYLSLSFLSLFAFGRLQTSLPKGLKPLFAPSHPFLPPELIKMVK
jgi:hypothetical protein